MAKPAGLRRECEDGGGTFGNEEILILVIMIQSSIHSSTKCGPQVAAARLLVIFSLPVNVFFFV